MRSENLVDENIEFIAKKFPNAIVEARDENGNLSKMVDFDILKQELSKEIVESDKERYQMTWPGKKQAILTANAPVSMTLRPCKEDSVDFDNTKNIYIEGDNLDVLKVLRETYLGKIKMIYIDPPYNTGNDFVYNDDFVTDTDDYLQRSNQVDDQGNRMSVNSESNGRFHTDWLNMMYPRLKIAKDLMSEDAIIFISIDENEVANMRKIADEIFGTDRFIGQFNWMKTATPPSLSRNIRRKLEYILCYSKSYFINGLNGGSVEGGDMPLLNESNSKITLTFNKNSVFFKIPDGHYIAGKKDRVILENDIDIVNGKSNQDIILTGNFKWTQENLNLETKNGTKYWIKSDKFAIRYEREGERIKTPSNIISKEECGVGTNEDAQKDIIKLFGQKVMDYPKPVSLIKYLVKMNTSKSDIVLDFFSGSATTAHAVMQLNAEDGNNRKYIMVQLPEICDEQSEAYKAGYKNICEIGKERIRRAGYMLADEIKKSTRVFGKDKAPFENNEYDKSAMQMAVDKLNISDFSNSAIKDFEKLADKKIPDIGFRVFKLDSSNMKDTYYEPSQYSENLLDKLDENIKPDRTAEDLLFQVMLDLGLMLDSKIETKTINNKKVFIVGEYNETIAPDLICCFDSNVDNDTVTEIAKLKPRYCVFRDSSMAKDSVAVNFDQIFETYSPSTTRKVL